MSNKLKFGEISKGTLEKYIWKFGKQFGNVLSPVLK